MAKNVVTHITDYIDGSAEAEEVAFSFDGVDYSIDLGKKNRAALERALKPYLEVATRQSKQGRRSSARKVPANGNRDLAAIRSWAKEQGIDVSERGRIRASVVEQYDAAHSLVFLKRRVVA